MENHSPAINSSHDIRRVRLYSGLINLNLYFIVANQWERKVWLPNIKHRKFQSTLQTIFQASPNIVETVKIGRKEHKLFVRKHFVINLQIHGRYRQWLKFLFFIIIFLRYSHISISCVTSISFFAYIYLIKHFQQIFCLVHHLDSYLITQPNYRSTPVNYHSTVHWPQIHHTHTLRYAFRPIFWYNMHFTNLKSCVNPFIHHLTFMLTELTIALRPHTKPNYRHVWFYFCFDTNHSNVHVLLTLSGSFPISYMVSSEKNW